MGSDRRRLEHLVPIAQLVAPELALEHFAAALYSFRELLIRDREPRGVRESVDVRVLQPGEQNPVEPHEFLRAALHRLTVHLSPVARHWARKVNRVQGPRTRTGRLERKCGRRLYLTH